MSDDMANELRREAAVLAATMPHLDVSLVVEAADRIEALEAERDSLATTIDGWVDKVHALEAELERIHAVMAEVDDEVDPLDAELADAHAIESDLRAELAAERAKTRNERDLRRRYGIAYAKKVQQLHEAAEDHAQSLAALTDARLEVRYWQAEVAAHRAARTPQEKP